jgi:hypothetical protein
MTKKAKRQSMHIDGLLVVDATKDVVLKVTDNDVNMSHTKQPGACAAASCAMRLKGVQAARVHVGRSYLLIGNKWRRFKTDPNLRQEIIAFDRGGKFMPGTYTLRVLTEWERPSNRKQGPVGRKRGKVKNKRGAYHKVSAVRECKTMRGSGRPK